MAKDPGELKAAAWARKRSDRQTPAKLVTGREPSTGLVVSTCPACKRPGTMERMRKDPTMAICSRCSFKVKIHATAQRPRTDPLKEKAAQVAARVMAERPETQRGYALRAKVGGVIRRATVTGETEAVEAFKAFVKNGAEAVMVVSATGEIISSYTAPAKAEEKAPRIDAFIRDLIGMRRSSAEKAEAARTRGAAVKVQRLEKTLAEAIAKGERVPRASAPTVERKVRRSKEEIAAEKAEKEAEKAAAEKAAQQAEELRLEQLRLDREKARENVKAVQERNQRAQDRTKAYIERLAAEKAAARRQKVLDEIAAEKKAREDRRGR
jgi:hypothetical protein